MADFDKEILSEFLQESDRLVDECEELLESIESDPSQAQRLAEFSNKIDRVMGAAKSLAMMADAQHPLHIIGDITALCKALGERGAKTAAHQRLFEVTVAFLLDGVEITRSLLETLENPNASVSPELKNAMLSRVNWIADVYRKLPKEFLDGIGGEKLKQNEIDDIIRKLGEG